jgi:leader peptidase (prepilin peptidase) / N-methyltransferase
MNSGPLMLRTMTLMSVTVVAQKQGLNVATALLFGLAIWRLGLSPELPAVLAFIFGGVLLSAIDWKVQRLPTRLVYYTLAGVGAGLLFASLVEWDWVPLATAAAGGMLFANAFFLIWFVGRNFAGMMLVGLGDVRLALLLGLLLGWYGLPYVLYGAIAGNILALVLVVATCIQKRQLHLRYSFGPPLIAGTLAVVLFHA